MFRKFLLGAAILLALSLVILVLPGQAAPEASSAAAPAAQTNDPEAPQPVFQAHLTGANLSPAVDTEARGRMLAVLSSALNELHYRIMFSGAISVTTVQIHLGEAGENGPAVFTLFDTAAGDVFNPDVPISGTQALTLDQITSLVTGNYYVLVQSEAYPEGELRGQLGLFVPARRFEALLSGEEEVPPVNTEASGRARFQLNGRLDQLSYEVNVRNIEAITAAHLHTGRPGEEGPPVIPLYAGSGEFDEAHPLSGSTAITPQQLLDLLTGNLYINVHTSANPEGEIRGQVGGGLMAFWADLSGANFPTPVETGAGGQAIFVFDQTAGLLHYRITTTGPITPTAALVRAGGQGQPFSLTLFSGSPPLDANGSISGTVELSLDWSPGLLVGGFFVEVQSEAYPNGELRGRIRPFFARHFTAVMTGDQETPPVPTEATGVGRFRLHPGLTQLDYHIGVSGVVSVTAAHLHAGWPGEVGPPVIPFPDAPALAEDHPISGTVGIDASQLLDLLSGRLYANVHTPEHPAGEIRGQVERTVRLFKAHLTEEGAAGQGQALMLLDPKLDALYYYISVTGIPTTTAVHIHLGHPAEGGEMVFDLLGEGDTLAPGEPLVGKVSLTEAHAAALLSGRYYLAVLYGGEPGGELVGQITPFRPRLNWLANLSGGGAGPGSGPEGTVRLWTQASADRLYFDISITGVSDISAIRLRSNTGSGQSVILFGDDDRSAGVNGGRFRGSVEVDAAALLALTNGELALEVFSGGSSQPILTGAAVQQGSLYLPLVSLNAGVTE